MVFPLFNTTLFIILLIQTPRRELCSGIKAKTIKGVQGGVVCHVAEIFKRGKRKLHNSVEQVTCKWSTVFHPFGKIKSLEITTMLIITILFSMNILGTFKRQNSQF